MTREARLMSGIMLILVPSPRRLSIFRAIREGRLAKVTDTVEEVLWMFGANR